MFSPSKLLLLSTAILFLFAGVLFGKHLKNGSTSFSKEVKVYVFAPIDAADRIREVMENVGVGKIGNYTDCTYTSPTGYGRFRPLEGSNPTIGKIGELVKVPEVIIQARVSQQDVTQLIQAIKKVHPYETPGIDVQPLLEF